MTALRFSLAMLLCGISVSVLEAQQTQPRGASGAGVPATRGTRPAGAVPQQARQPRPQPPANGVVPAGAVEPLKPLDDPDLKRILDNWGNSSAEIQELRGTHQRFVFDKVFMTEKRSTGNFYYMAPDKGRIDLKPTPVGKGAKSRMEGYTLQPDRAERWICDGFQIITINDEAKEYEKFPLPVEMRGQNIINGPLPFLFGLKANEAHARYELVLLQHDQQKATAVIKATPRRQEDLANYSEARIILDTKINLPKAVRLLDPPGTRITEYWFEDLEPNAAGIRQAVRKLMGDDPFHPSVNGYKTVQTPQGNPPPGAGPQPREGGLAPAPRNAIRPVDGKGKVRLE